jgi:hypothetical protein
LDNFFIWSPWLHGRSCRINFQREKDEWWNLAKLLNNWLVQIKKNKILPLMIFMKAKFAKRWNIYYSEQTKWKFKSNRKDFEIKIYLHTYVFVCACVFRRAPMYIHTIQNFVVSFPGWSYLAIFCQIGNYLLWAVFINLPT